jgi:tetratricopeptide (TPR) repeat protein
MIVIAVLVFSGWNFGIPELSHRAFHWLVTPRYDDALNDFATLLRRDPNSGDRLIDRGEVLEKMGRREEALADYTQAIIAARNNYDKQMEKEREQARKEEHARNRD